MMSIVTAVFSAFLDNVTTVLLTVPVTLLITEELKVKPYPYLFAQIFASNIGGTATLIGDPPNIMIGSATGLTFNDFALALTPVILVDHGRRRWCRSTSSGAGTSSRPTRTGGT